MIVMLLSRLVHLYPRGGGRKEKKGERGGLDIAMVHCAAGFSIAPQIGKKEEGGEEGEEGAQRQR